MKAIDVHSHYGRNYLLGGKEVTVDFLLKQMNEHNIEKTLLSSFLAIHYDLVEGNKELKEIIDKHDNLLGMVVVNSNYVKISLKELETYLKHENFVGVKMHPNLTGHPINSAQSKEILKAVERYNVPILIHTWGEAHLNQILDVANDSPNLKILIGHMGGIKDWRKGIEVAGKTKNTYLDITRSSAPQGEIEEAVMRVGAERVLFGTDFPFLSYAFALGRLKDASISNKEKEMILYDNAKKLFRI